MKHVCSNPGVVREAIRQKLEALEAEQSELDAEVERLQAEMDKLTTERQWAITEKDMEMQLAGLQFQELSLHKTLDEQRGLSAARMQAEALSAWADQYLGDINTAVQKLEVDTESLSDDECKTLAAELQADRFESRYLGDERAQLRWAILEEKRRVIRTLISRVTVGTAENGRGRIFKATLALEIPTAATGDFLDYGRQSLNYVKQAGREKADVRGLPAK